MLCVIYTFGLPINAQIDTTLAAFFPMHIGNVWEYWVDSNIPPELMRVEVEKDTLMPNGESYRVFQYTGAYNHTLYFRMDDSLRIIKYGAPDSCNNENIVFDLSLPDSSLIAECYSEFPEDNFPALHNTFGWGYSELGLSASTKKYGGVEIDPFTGDTLWGSIFYTENWLAKGIGISFSQPEAGATERVRGAVINGITYGTITSINYLSQSNVFIEEIELFDSYPNPFNGLANIVFKLKKHANLRLTIYDSIGREIITLFQGNKASGQYKFTWNGKNSIGDKVASGRYYYVLTTKTSIATHSLTLIQ